MPTSIRNVGASQDRMRTMHDGILIGIGTAVNDNPQLNGAYHIPLSFPPATQQQLINDPF
jgi:riboflavin biosynthesis pyrimidine reductase